MGQLSDSNVERLIEAISGLDHKVTQLTLRLTGDPSLQTIGLIQEVSRTREKLDTLIDAGNSHGRRLDALEAQNRDQAGMLEDLKVIRTLTNRGWKVLAILITGGVLQPLIAGGLGKLLGFK